MKVNSLAEWLMCRYFFHGPFGNWMFSSAGAGFRQESLKGDPEAGRQAGVWCAWAPERKPGDG